MEFIYKMNDGSIIKLESYDLLNHIVYGFNFGYNIYKKALLIENGKKKSITIRLKENNDLLYFIHNREIKYVRDFEYIKLEDLIKMNKTGVKISYDLFVTTLYKELNRIAFMKNIRVPSSRAEFFGHIMLTYGKENINYKMLFTPELNGTLLAKLTPYYKEDKDLTITSTESIGSIWDDINGGLIEITSLDEALKSYEPYKQKELTKKLTKW